MDGITKLFTLTPNQLANVLIILGLMALIIMICSIIVVAMGYNVFNKAGKKGNESFVPIYNIIVFLQICKIPGYYFFTLMVPGLNIILIIYALFNLGKLFKVKSGFMAGLIFCPLVFIPLLGHSDYKYDEEEEEELVSIADDIYTVYTQEQLDKLNEEYIPNTDNVFRSEVKVFEKPSAYKARDIKLNTDFMLQEDNAITKIYRQKPVHSLDIVNGKLMAKEEEKIEIVEL